tara:strand:- start:61 stop:1473 length:1413 start_codon:yes stop_codon:yes gene_type:complete
MSNIFGTDVDFNKNELSNVRLTGELNFPTVALSDAGLVMFNSGQNSFYGWNGTGWVNFDGSTNGSYLLNTTDTLNGNLTVSDMLNVGRTENGYTLNIGTTVSGSIFTDGKIFSAGNIYAAGTVLGSNLTGVNTGDQDLGTYALLTDITGTNSGINTGDQDISGIGINATAISFNTSKISFDSVSSTRLANTSGINTGDQALPTDFISASSGGTFLGGITATSFSVTGGISEQFLTGDGSLNQNVVTTNTVNNFTKQQHFQIQTLTSGSTVEWDLSSNQKAIISHDQIITLNNPTNMMSGASYVLYLQHGVTASAFTFSSSYKFPSDITPTLSQGGSSLDIIQFESDGIYMYCVNTSLNISGSSGVADTTPPTNPSTFTAYLGVDAIELSWSDSTDNVAVDRYFIERLDDVTNTWTILPDGNVSAPTTTLSDSYFLVSGVTYSYRMRTADEANNISTKYKLADADVTYYPA